MNIKFNIEPKKPESAVFTSRAELTADKFKQWVLKKDLNIAELNSEEIIKEYITKSHLLMPGVTIDEIIDILKKSRAITIPPPEKVVHLPKKIETIATEHQILKGVTEVKDENLLKQRDENKFFEVLEKDIFKNPKDLDFILDKSLRLGKDNYAETPETIDDYYEFADANLLQGGRPEAERDFRESISLEEKFKKERESLGKEKSDNKEKIKKVGTIMESGIAYAVTNLNWYGKHITMEPVCKIVDYKYHTDKLLQIQKGVDENNFLGLGVDVTYSGILGPIYKDKLFKILDSIYKGYETKIKYFKNHNGDLMKEFSVPSIILHFNTNEVKDMVYLIKNIDNPKIKEEFRNSPQKFAVMNQVLIQCELLADFAERHQKRIFRKYIDIVHSIKELAWKDPEIKKILDARHEDEASIHMKYLITEFNDKIK